MKNPGLMYSIAAIFFGVISVAVCMIFFISFPAAVFSITFGIFAVRRYYRKSGTTAIVLGIIGTVLTIIIFVNIVQALNVDSLIAGNWNTENNQRIEFTDSGAYIWYLDSVYKNKYTSGYYTLSSGLYKNKNQYTMGYTVTFKQLNYCEGNKTQKEQITSKWLIYTPGEEVLETKSDDYEMMNLQTGQVIKISKEKVKLFGIFEI